MDGVGEVDGRGAGGQGHDLALGRENEDLVVEHLDLQRVDIVLGVRLLLCLQQAANPFKLLFVAALDALLVFPVCGDAVFRRFVHLPGADLHLEGDALPADDGGVQALIHIGLGGGNIILKTPGHQIEQVVDVTQHIITVGNGINDHPESIHIIQLAYALALCLHFAVDGIDVLDAAVNCAVDADRGQTGGDLALDGLHKFVGLGLMGLKVLHDLIVARGVEILEAGILQLPFDLLHAETVRQRGVDVHRLAGF